MALNLEEKELIGLSLTHQLSQTPYACAALRILGGGTANFIFRGTLAQALPNARDTVVIKHSKEYVSANRDFGLDISRCVRSLLCLSFHVLLNPGVRTDGY
jgi:hypothetical protein